MSERNNIENILGLTEYPSSSDDECNVPGPTATQGWHEQQPHQAQTSRDADEVINLDESPAPNVSSPTDQVELNPPMPARDQRGERAAVDNNLLWSAIGNSQSYNNWARSGGTDRFIARTMHPGYGMSNESGSGSQETRPLLFRQHSTPSEFRTSELGTRAMVHRPVPELSRPQLPHSASADILSIMAFKRLQRYRAYRRNRARLLGPALSSLPPLDLSRGSSPRAGSRSNRAAPVTFDRIMSSFINFEVSPLTATSGAERQPEGAEQNETEDNGNDQSGAETESGELSPAAPGRLPAPDDQPQTMEVDQPNDASPQEGEAGDGEDESEDSAPAASPAPSGGNVNNTPDEPENASERIFVDVRRRSRGHKRRRDTERQRTEAFNVKEFNLNLLRLLECPVCLEWMEPPMLQCRLGHLVCARCRARLSTCPVCRSGFSSVRNRAMEGVAELLRYPCRHGCGREARLRRRAAHEASCPRRRYRCPARSCTEHPPQPYDDLVRHVQRNHAAMIKVGRLHKFSVALNAHQHDNWLIMTGFGLFHLRIAIDVRISSVMAYVAYIGPKCRAKEFTYEVTIVGQHNGRKLVYTRATHSDLESTSLNLSRQDCFHVTLDEAINFLRFRNRHYQPDRLLDFTVEITKQDVISVDNNSVISDG